MATEIILPPGYSVRLDYDPDMAPLSLYVQVFREGDWVGDARVNPGAARAGQLQEIVDVLTKRTTRSMTAGGSDLP